MNDTQRTFDPATNPEGAPKVTTPETPKITTPPQPQVPHLSRKQRMAKLATLEKATMLTQQLTRSLMQAVQNMGQDLKMYGLVLDDYRYKLEELIKMTGIDQAVLSANVDAQRIIDFNEQAAKEDAQEGLISAETVGDNSTIIITSLTEKGTGTLRSRLPLSDPRIKDVKDLTLGKKVGDKFNYTMNNEKHVVEILDIKDPTPTKDENTTNEQETPPAA